MHKCRFHNLKKITTICSSTCRTIAIFFFSFLGKYLELKYNIMEVNFTGIPARVSLRTVVRSRFQFFGQVWWHAGDWKFYFLQIEFATCRLIGNLNALKFVLLVNSVEFLALPGLTTAHACTRTEIRNTHTHPQTFVFLKR